MRICVFMHRFNDGGAEKATIRLINELKRRGHRVTLAVRYDEGPAKENLSDAVGVVDMHLPKAGKLRKNLINVCKLMKLMKSQEYDVMVAIMSDMSQVAALSKRLSASRMPLVSVVHSTLSVEQMSFRGLRNRLMAGFDRQYDRVVAVSEAVRMDYVRCCRAAQGKTVTVYNPIVDAAMIEKAKLRPDHPWLAANRPFYTLLLAGRLSYPKNHPLMLRTLKRLRESGDYRLILLGEGELRKELEALTRELGLEEWVDFRGYVKNPYGYMAFSDCVVLSSRYEGLPTVLVEALACGSRIVSTDCPGGSREILRDRYGILVKTEDEAALAQGIIRAVHGKADRALLLGRAMDFTVEKATADFERVLQSLTERE